MLKAGRTVSLRSNFLFLLLSKTSLGDSRDPTVSVASCVDKALTWETRHVGSALSPATHPVQPWASHFLSLGLPCPICMEDCEPSDTGARHQRFWDAGLLPSRIPLLN